MSVRHPAKFTDAILDEAIEMLDDAFTGDEWEVLIFDPFAGTGKGVDFLNEAGGYVAFGTELEPEWATQSDRVLVGDGLKYMATHPESVDGVFTSPAYGNRMADHHEAKDTSKRNTYRHQLGRPLTEGSAAGMQWGDEYKAFHATAWAAVYLMLKPGGHFLLNIKDHIRKGEQVGVTEWHRRAIKALGFTVVADRFVETQGNRHGANGAARVGGEWLIMFRKPEA